VNILFRTDASLDIGTGHVMRCLTLADALRERGAHCRFVCRIHPGNLIELIRQRGFEVLELPFDGKWKGTDGANPEHASWLGADWVTDAAQTKVGAGDTAVDWLIVDHYSLDSRWEVALGETYCKLMVIDDLADRPHNGDLLLDQNWFGAAIHARYQGLVPDHCQCFFGPEYALLRPEYMQLRAAQFPRGGAVRRVLVFLGGSDPSNQTAKVLAALMNPGFAHLQVDVVTGHNHPDTQGIAAQVAARAGTTLHQNLPTLGPLMVQGDLMISAGGSTTWERMCLGLPAIVISVADNQTNINSALMNAGYINFLGEMKQVTTEAITQALQFSLLNPDVLKVQSHLGQTLVDGTGASKLAEVLLVSDGSFAIPRAIT
jgi:UDP-2,4-diacetamido-2,4,6-trideoxy-beta-L-altropyranose hydrolase